jgi:hypothetical protein
VKTLSDQQYESLRSGAIVLSADKHGEKVLERSDGCVIKLFRRKRWMSSEIWSPYARRFARASRRLHQLGVPAARVEGLYWVPGIERHAVVYPKLPGETLRAAVADSHRCRGLMLSFAGFLARLHSLGVYFRAVHFGNVLVQADGAFALIDISEAQFRRRFGVELRARNFRPLVRYAEDAAALEIAGADRFVKAYLEHAHLTQRSQWSLLDRLRGIHPLFIQACDHAASGLRQVSGPPPRDDKRGVMGQESAK